MAAPANPCPSTGGRHRYMGGAQCIRCGQDKPTPTSTRERRPARAASSVSKAQYRQSIALGISGVQNLFFAFIAPELVEDALMPDEIALLSDALSDEITMSPRIVKLINSVRERGGKHGKLIMALLLIALPRLARRGVIPEGADDVVKAAIAVAMAPRPASNSDRGDGERQEYVGESSADASQVRDRRTNEAGRCDVSSGDGDLEGIADIEFEIEPVRATA